MNYLFYYEYTPRMHHAKNQADYLLRYTINRIVYHILKSAITKQIRATP